MVVVVVAECRRVLFHSTFSKKQKSSLDSTFCDNESARLGSWGVWAYIAWGRRADRKVNTKCPTTRSLLYKSRQTSKEKMVRGRQKSDPTAGFYSSRLKGESEAAAIQQICRRQQTLAIFLFSFSSCCCCSRFCWWNGWCCCRKLIPRMRKKRKSRMYPKAMCVCDCTDRTHPFYTDTVNCVW